MYQSPYSNPNPLDKSPFFYTPNNLLLKPFSPSFRNPSPIKEKPNLSNAETSDYLTPRIGTFPYKTL